MHGEVKTINNFFDLNEKINPKDCIFLSSHEPCSLCLSAITWSGFDNFYYFFPYKDTKNKFSIPHDLNIMSQVFKLENGAYNNQNSYWQGYSIINEISNLSKDTKNKLNFKIDYINQEYEKLSDKYIKNRNKNKIPLN